MNASLLERNVVAPVQRAELQVRREGIRFRNIGQDRLRVSVTVTNHGNVDSQPTVMFLQAAPLGAFVPWQDITFATVPCIAPHQSVDVTVDVTTPLPKALGNFSGVPPRRLLTAIGAGDESPSGKAPANPVASVLWNLLRGNAPTEPDTALPADPLSLLSRPNVHWAGNINVLIGHHAVERHLAQALRIYAGRQNLALFFVGDEPDEYKFELTGGGVDWEAKLFDFTDMASLLGSRSSANVIAESKWVKMAGCRIVLLAIQPPEHCGAGEIQVHVRQRSTDREAIVEFTLDPNAIGAGCYAV
ncbi:MAG TPA: hypothetical protein P5307_07035 [Pirellulaceae bacterium]|nr:hypothetical protein [Pirellulaceae bacterium]